MVVLEWNNAVKCLALAVPGLYADLLCDLKEGRDCAFQSHGAVIIKAVWYGSERYIWYLCDTGRCDMAAALMDLKQSNTDNLDIIRIYTGRCEGLHCLIYSRMGEPYTDRDILRCLYRMANACAASRKPPMEKRKLIKLFWIIFPKNFCICKAIPRFVYWGYFRRAVWQGLFP